MSLLITNGRIITASDDYVADVYCNDGVIVAIGKNLPSHRFQADRTIDASGKYVIPGGIDVHTHLNMPFGGTTSADDFESGTMLEKYAPILIFLIVAGAVSVVLLFLGFTFGRGRKDPQKLAP